jgi:hypothetical protein
MNCITRNTQSESYQSHQRYSFRFEMIMKLFIYNFLLLPLLALAIFFPSEALAYDPGTGNVFSENFASMDDEGWDNGLGGTASTWALNFFNDSMAYSTDGIPDSGMLSLHASAHILHPVPSTTFSIAFYLYSEGGSGFYFYIDLEQRGCAKRLYRLMIKNDGSLELWGIDGSGSDPIYLAGTGSNEFRFRKDQWIRFAIEGTDFPIIKARVWSRKPEQEPATWALEFQDLDSMVERVSKMTIATDGPSNKMTYIDDIDAYGDTSLGVVSSIKTIYLMELSHLDIGFTKPPDEIEAFCKTHLDQVVSNVKSNPGYLWNIEAVWHLERWMERSTSTEIEEMFDLIRQGRIAVMGGYANLRSHGNGYEELIRSLYRGLRLAKEHSFNIRSYVQDDVPGNNYAIPEMLTKGGLEYYIGGMNCSFGGRTNHPSHAERPFYWIGADGSKVLSWVTFDGYAEAFSYGFSFFDNFAALFQKLGEKLPEQEELCYPYDTLLLMRGFDNHYQGLHAKNLVDQWNATYDTPVFILCTPGDFFDAMIAKYGSESFPEFYGDWGNAWGTGGPIQAHATANNRKAHRVGRAGENFASISDAYGFQANPTTDVRFMYRKMLEYDEHSGGGGGWPGYFTPEETDRNNRIHQGYAQDARDTAEQILIDSIDSLSANISIDQDAVVVFNPLGWRRTGWVQASLPPEVYNGTFRLIDTATGNEIPYQRFDETSKILFFAEEIPSMGYKVYKIEDGTPDPPGTGLLQVTGSTLENDYYLITVDPSDGSISSIYDKVRDRELVDSSSDFKFNGAAYTYHLTHFFGGNSTPDSPSGASATVNLDGPLAASILITKNDTPQVESEIKIYRWHNLIEIRNVFDRNMMPYVDYDSHSMIWAATFPFDIHDFEFRSETTSKFLNPPSDQFDRTSLFPNHVVEHSIAFWDSSVGILSASPETSCEDFERMANTASTFPTTDATLFHRVKSKADEAKFDDDSIGPYEAEPDTSPQYEIFHYFKADTPNFQDSESMKFGAENCDMMPSKYLSSQIGSLPRTDKSFFSADADNVFLYTVKKSEDESGTILRILELDGLSTTVRIDSSLILSNPLKVSFFEEGGEPLTLDLGRVVCDLSPYETVTIKVNTEVPLLLNLEASKDYENDAVHLFWSGGKAPFTIKRSQTADFSDYEILATDTYNNSHDDMGALSDGVTYYYRVESR